MEPWSPHVFCWQVHRWISMWLSWSWTINTFILPPPHQDLSLVSIWSSRSSRSSRSSQSRIKRSGRSYGNTTETTETTRTIGTITIAWIASSSIRTIEAIVKICKRLNGNLTCQRTAKKPLSRDADDRSDPNISQNAPVIPKFNALFALGSKKCGRSGRSYGNQA